MKIDSINNYAPLISRVLISILFIVSGFFKIIAFQSTKGFMASAGFPVAGLFLVLAIIFEIGGGFSLLLGFYSKIGAWALILFTIIATLIFHLNFSDQVQMTSFLKNLAIIGGLLLIANHGPGHFSLTKD